jgi:hypothetical protein
LVFLLILIFAPAPASASCEAVMKSAERRMEKENEREAERRKAGFPEKGADESFVEECLGSVYKGGSFPGFPPVPDIGDAVKDLCREARGKIAGNRVLRLFPFPGLEKSSPFNAVREWRGDLNEEIWDALNRY